MKSLKNLEEVKSLVGSELGVANGIKFHHPKYLNLERLLETNNGFILLQLELNYCLPLNQQ